jgi:hypothetical protein
MAHIAQVLLPPLTTAEVLGALTNLTGAMPCLKLKWGKGSNKLMQVRNYVPKEVMTSGALVDVAAPDHHHLL